MEEKVREGGSFFDKNYKGKHYWKYLLKKHIQDNPFIPHTPFKKQVEMIMRPEREVLVDGAAGGSKPTTYA